MASAAAAMTTPTTAAAMGSSGGRMTASPGVAPTAAKSSSGGRGKMGLVVVIRMAVNPGSVVVIAAVIGARIDPHSHSDCAITRASDESKRSDGDRSSAGKDKN